MADRTDLGIQLNRNGAGTGSTLLDGTSRAGSTFNVGATGDMAAWLVVTATSANLTNCIFKVQTSYDGTNWVDVYTTRASTAVTAVSHTVTAVAGSSVYEALMTTNSRLFNYGRVMVQGTLGGAIGATESAAVYIKAGF